MDAPALERCVGDVDRFFNEYWSRRPLLFERPEEGTSFDDLASLDDLDRMVSSLGLRVSSLRMVKDGKTLDPSAYTTPPKAKSRGTEAAVSPALVYMCFHEGATIALEGLHRYWEPLADFCRDLEVTLGHRLQVNAYITPPGAKGFDVHRDDHDVFVLQVSGTKHWLVHDGEDVDNVLIDASLERGDSLYIPMGFPHAATTGVGSSAHLTVGILTHHSIDVLREITKLAEDEPSFQQRLDLGSTSDLPKLRALVERHVEDLQTWLDKLDVDDVTERLARRILSTAQPILRGQLSQLDLLPTIDESSMLARRRGAICVVRRKDRGLRILLADRELEMPLELAGAMEHIAIRERFRTHELHSFLDPQSALVLVRRLVREGLLEVVVA
jgi:bifunctional lysine-specific demethylase and histidyl-hydroxylase NO66